MSDQIPQIEKYIREMIAGRSFNREAIIMQSKEWIEKFPFEFNSVLNMIEAEGRNIDYDGYANYSVHSVKFRDGYANDSMTEVTFHGDCADDSVPSVALHGGYADDSVPSVAFHGGYADDSIPSVSLLHSGYSYNSVTEVTFHDGCIDDSMPSVAIHDDYSGCIIPDHMSSVSNSPMGSERIDSSPGGYPDDDFPLQRTMSDGS